MTKATLLKYKAIYENNGNTIQLAKVLKNLERLEVQENAKQKKEK